MMGIQNRLTSAARNKFLAPIIKLLIQGIHPRQIALAIAGAIVIGIFPVIGATTLLCTLFAVRLKLNLPLVQLVNYSVAPLQLVTIVPFMKLGEIFGYEKLRYSLGEIVTMVGTSPLTAVSVLWNVTMQAIGAWVLLAPLMGYLLYKLLNYLIAKINLSKYPAFAVEQEQTKTL